MGSRLALQREPLLFMAQRMSRNEIEAVKVLERTTFVPRLERLNREVVDLASACLSRKSTTETLKSFRSKHRTCSQAGRRGFDPRLPLHVFNGLEVFESLSITAITALSSPITSRSRLEGVTSTFQPNFRTSHAASIFQKDSI